MELAEISLWLNTMYPGMRAPWYGLHLHRGNSLIGAARKVYPGKSLGDGGWLKSSGQQAPRAVPLTEALGGSGVHRPVHQFLLPALGWGSVGDSVSVRKATGKSVVAGAVAEWLEPSLIEAMKKWRSGMRRAPQGGKKSSPAASKKAPTSQATVLEREERSGQGALELGLEIWEQSGFDFAAAAPAPAPVKRSASLSAPTDVDDGSYGQTGRLRALSERVEYLWGLVRLRLELSEQEISRDIPVWGAEGRGAGSAPVMDREAVREALQMEGSPYWRLKQVMDAWCALWFWPLEEVPLLDGTAPDYFDGAQDLKRRGKGAVGRKVALRKLDDWIEFAESVVGRVDVEPGKDAGSLFEMPKVNGLKGLDEFEQALDDKMTEISGWVDALNLGDLFPWHGTAVRIAKEKGFLHWELDFAHVFAAGGFDLMVGNPPWVKQEWKESGVLAEFEPWFELAEKPSNEAWAERKAEVLGGAAARAAFLGELADSAAVSGYLASVDAYPELVGTQPDLYRAFMLLVWRATGTRGVAGLIHPSSHLTGAKEGTLRKSTYRHLRLHADFENQRSLFAKPVGHSRHFSVNVYGRPRQEIRFQHLSWLFAPETLSESVRDQKVGRPLPGLKHDGRWDIRPHKDRVLTVDKDVLADWRKLASEESPAPLEETKLLFPVTTAEEAAIAALARWPYRLGALDPRISPGFHEKNDRTAGYFTWEPGPADTWADVILQGPMFGVATPFLRKAVAANRMEAWHTAPLEEDAVQHTNYRPAGGRARYVAAQDRWVDHVRLAQLQGDPAAVAAAEADVRATDPNMDPDACELAVEALLIAESTRPYSDFYRVAWREMIASDTERSLYSAVIPPGTNHVHTVRSAALSSSHTTALTGGFFASLPLDYLLRSSGRGHLDISDAKTMPAPTPGHPLEQALLLRTLRLNAQTNAYAPLWEELYAPAWQEDSWAAAPRWPDDTPPLTEGVGPTWTRDTPLRAEFARRAALVEIDALVAVWLGISADELVAMYRARFPVLQQYEENMWFDATGRRIAKAHQQHGYGQPKDAWKQLSSHEHFPLEANVPDGYEGPLYRANRVEEMRAAHAEFTRRMRAVGWEPGDTEPPTPAE
ncbi:Eco57I restriction-modification methylase domain-containing protein [Streptomyces sp. NPDC048567]|uniref:Eco57I restriction-modification methylase domain-containing protein n=1 Tax=Streptomyces sp. NPDC048567 TaxID=3365570 RepID=UPI00370FC869